MPRPRKNAGGGTTPTAGQAAYVLDRLLAERRISPAEVSRYIGEMGREISDLEQRLARLREAAAPAAAALAGFAAGAVVGRRRGRTGRPPGRPPGRPGRPPGRPPASEAPAKRGRRRRGAITPEQLASRQLQGRYLALVRQFAKSRRAQFAKTAKDKGREAAIKEMQDALKK
jgi:hypothetical protein